MLIYYYYYTSKFHFSLVYKYYTYPYIIISYINMQSELLVIHFFTSFILMHFMLLHWMHESFERVIKTLSCNAV